MQLHGSAPGDVADWRRIEGLWRQCVDIFDAKQVVDLHVPDVLLDDLAKHTARVFASYDSREDLFIEHLMVVMAEVEGRPPGVETFKAFYHDERFDSIASYQVDGPGRRRPRPFEASVETARRLRDLGRIQDQLADLELGCILGGSTSYGRFYNTTGAQTGKASDVDLLLVASPGASIEQVLSRLGSIRGLEGVDEAKARAEHLPDLRSRLADGRLVFSHKFRMWESSRDDVLDKHDLAGGYPVSLHFVTLEDFLFLILADVPSIADGLERKIWDYRQSDPGRRDKFKSFSGTERVVERPMEEVEDGFLAQSVVCTAADERFRPGLHQNLILPQFDLRWDARRHRIRLPLYGFRWKITERIAREKEKLPYEVQRISHSHPRGPAFAPHITHRVDRNA